MLITFLKKVSQKFFSLKLMYYISSIIKIKIMTGRRQAIDNLRKLRDAGVSDEEITDYLILNWMSGADAKQATEDLLKEQDLDDSDEDSDDE